MRGGPFGTAPEAVATRRAADLRRVRGAPGRGLGYGSRPMSSPSETPARPRPLVLVILDGFGERAECEDNAICQAKTPALDSIRLRYPHSVISTSGRDVGLPPGQMGNSEVGHLNFGAGRIAQMDISRIDTEVFDGTLGNN